MIEDDSSHSFLQTNTTELVTDGIISEDDVQMMIVYELGVKSVPSVLFLIAATMRFCEIRSIGFARIMHYSVFFMCKIVSSLLLSFLNLLLVLLAMSMRKDAHQSLWMVKTDHRLLSLVYLVDVAAWAASAALLTYEYRKRLSEAIYSHFMFWFLNFVLILVVVILNYKYYVSNS